MNIYILAMTLIGLAALAMAWLPSWLENRPVSYAMLFVGLGYVLYQLPLDLPNPDPLRNEGLTVRLTEIGLITSLMGTGLKINRDFGWKNWKIPFLLVGITMILCIGALGFLGWWLLGLVPASALLLGAAMAPTDPVLAADVQVGPPSDEKEDHVRFSLTTEAGMNDSMAFPFTWMAIAIALAAETGETWFWPWLWRDLFYKIIVGVALGYLLGRLLAYLLFVLPKKNVIPQVRDGFVAIAATLMVYGATELIHGYGFVAVFVAGLTIGNHEKPHKYHRELHDFTEQIERIFLVIILLLFGGSLARGLLVELTGTGVVVGLAFVFVIRPVLSYLTIARQNVTVREKLAISFFGIRGIGSLYYLSFASTQAYFPDERMVWALAGFIVLVSVVVHGVLATPAMRYLDLHRKPGDLEIK
jgi:NhaP-type Na+/H+ or K+/H+ antiporter